MNEKPLAGSMRRQAGGCGAPGTAVTLAAVSMKNSEAAWEHLICSRLEGRPGSSSLGSDSLMKYFCDKFKVCQVP